MSKADIVIKQVTPGSTIIHGYVAVRMDHTNSTTSAESDLYYSQIFSMLQGLTHEFMTHSIIGAKVTRVGFYRTYEVEEEPRPRRPVS